MFKQDKAKSTTENSKEQNKISPGTKIKGNIEAKGGFRIDGCVEGTVKTPGKVVIGKDGYVKGELECENADIEGKFSGNLKIQGTLSLRSTAVIEGEAVVSKLAVEPGATFNATCTMRGGVKAIRNERGEKQRQEQSA
ncbi:bactofilin family protein [Salinimicrobium sediminilitoris]|uniref:bactofilin family protein n=1 Tax=Salinimicrobium sediminilitoris TaxID=2876715 RepID=UPI001E28FCE2|nr:polymer-forming cytoskeletal protein [Salinimicrobium sediminilitoris]MCC8359571.1 polymer-forming cytoskeletal protein [Salinimicrobium sediminilitoris]